MRGGAYGVFSLFCGSSGEGRTGGGRRRGSPAESGKAAALRSEAASGGTGDLPGAAGTPRRDAGSASLPPGGSGGRGFCSGCRRQRPGGPTGGPTVPQDGNPRQHGGRRGGDLPLSGAHPKGDADGGGLHRGGEPRSGGLPPGPGWRRRCRTGPRRSSCACMHTGSVSAPCPEPLRRQALAAALEACLERGRPLEPAEQERLLEEYRTGGERK